MLWIDALKQQHEMQSRGHAWLRFPSRRTVRLGYEGGYDAVRRYARNVGAVSKRAKRRRLSCH
jgi:hypothetical protein